MGKVDIVDIKTEVKNGAIDFFIKDGSLFCSHLVSQECVCVKTQVVDKSDSPTLIELSTIYAAIKITENGIDKYFRYICNPWQGRFDGEIILASTIADATKYCVNEEEILEEVISSIKNVLHKNPDMSNPRIIFVGTK